MHFGNSRLPNLTGPKSAPGRFQPFGHPKQAHVCCVRPATDIRRLTREHAYNWDVPGARPTDRKRLALRCQCKPVKRSWRLGPNVRRIVPKAEKSVVSGIVRRGW